MSRILAGALFGAGSYVLRLLQLEELPSPTLQFTLEFAAAVILFDPIFQGLAISLLFGILVSTLLTLVVIPVLYYAFNRRQHEVRAEAAAA